MCEMSVLAHTVAVRLRIFFFLPQVMQLSKVLAKDVGELLNAAAGQEGKIGDTAARSGKDLKVRCACVLCALWVYFSAFFLVLSRSLFRLTL